MSNYTITTKVIERKSLPFPISSHDWFAHSGAYRVYVSINDVPFKWDYANSVRGIKRNVKRLTKKAHKEVARREAVAAAHTTETVTF